MTRCLRDDALLMLSCGDGSAAERAHLGSCAACDARYAQLTNDLSLIGRALSEPPPRTSAYRLHPRGIRWIPAAAAVAGMLVLVMGVTQFWSPSPVQVATQTASVSAFVDDVSSALFATSNEVALAESPSDMAHLQAALAGGWPCTRDQLYNGECDDQLAAVAWTEE